MRERAAIFRLHGPEYRAKCGDRMLPSHLQAMQDIEPCRTEALGGQLYHCEHCQASHDSSHSCKNRHCPTGQTTPADVWLEHHKSVLLPVTHFMVTCTLPEALRALARSHQKTLYTILFRSSAEALQELAMDHRCIGGKIGMVGVLQTWTRDLRSHPHVHDIVAGGGLAGESQWRPSRQDFLVHVKPLSVLFRATFRAQRPKTPLWPLGDTHVWTKDWVVHCKPVGSGQPAFRSLAPYILRVALSKNHLRKLEDGTVTLQSKEAATAQTPCCTVSAAEFMRRFLPHLLPDRCVKVRSYGLLSPSNRQLLHKAKALLGAGTIARPTAGKAPAGSQRAASKEPVDVPRCPKYGSMLMLVRTLRPTLPP